MIDPLPSGVDRFLKKRCFESGWFSNLPGSTESDSAVSEFGRGGDMCGRGMDVVGRGCRCSSLGDEYVVKSERCVDGECRGGLMR